MAHSLDDQRRKLPTPPSDEQGIVVFDELERARSHLLIDQMRRYFIETRKGQRRSWTSDLVRWALSGARNWIR